MPRSVIIVGDLAFENCSGLTDIYYKGSEEDWSEIESAVLVSLSDSVKVHFNNIPEK
jgi:hypothetical protein